MAKSIEAIDGIGPKFGAKLRNIGCSSPAVLLRDGATPKGRQEISTKTGISPAIILRCVNMADLFRVKGVASQYAELLEAAGVDTVKELRNRNAKNLAEAMRVMNEKKRLVRQVPNEKMIGSWISQAKQLAPMVKY